MHPVENYLKNLFEIYRTGGGTEEKSYYGALEQLLNEIGKKLKPKVRCVLELKNIGAGEPDFGLYTANQFQSAKDEKPIAGALPERGVIEVKPWSDDSFATSQSVQVTKYLKRYGLVLVTNYRDFVLIGHDKFGKAVRLETYRMTESLNNFRSLLAHPRKTSQEQGDRLVDFLRRVMLHTAPLTDPEDVAWFLASYAREARARVEQAAELPALSGLRKALEEALGMKFEGEKGEHFFRATLVQTLFYGIFSSWVLWARNHPTTDECFDWKDAAWTLHVPMIASLFEQIAMPNRLKRLGVDEVLNWAGMVLNRVDRPSFFEKFEEEHAVQYFYEPFLKAYDPELRKELGVWYTPTEIVKYQVERVDHVLRSELGIADGLADDNVVILDPCCGTGAYLVETLRRIHKTLEEKGASALTSQKLKRAAIERVFGFEILPAPFVVSHLQIGLMLRLLGAPLNPNSDERIGVYLTNALTGWEPPSDPKKKITQYEDPKQLKGKVEKILENLIAAGMPELAEEMKASREVKREKKILVVLGNPPYNAFAGTSPDEEGGLVEPYKQDLSEWGITKNYLDDLYVRFFRIAERRIVKSNKGVVSYISNFSYLADPSFVVMRKHFLNEFDKIWIDCMNGDSRETGKVTPDGKPDPSVFSTDQSPVGIRVGTAICVMVRKEKREKNCIVHFQHYWGVTKRQDILDSLRLKQINHKYKTAKPTRTTRYSFRPSRVPDHFFQWPRVTDLANTKPMLGLNENRQGALQDISKKYLIKRMKEYFDSSISNDYLFSKYPAIGTSKAGYNPSDVRSKVLASELFEVGRVTRYMTRPFDNRWAYISDVNPFWNRSRPELRDHFDYDNCFLLTRPSCPASPEGIPMLQTKLLGEQDLMRGHAYYFPLLSCEKSTTMGKLGIDDMLGHQDIEPMVTANLSERARVYLAQLGIEDPDRDAESAGLIWMHSLAIGYSPAYLDENADGIRQDWPRIPLPATKQALLKSAELGRRVAALLDTEKPVKGVTCGKILPEVKDIAVISKVGGGALNPDEGHLDLTAGWGHAGKGGVCMPGKGKYEIREQKHEKLKKGLGDKTLDVYLNDVAYWANIPESVWNYYIGGYQVIKKWLSYREKPLLGRGLKMEETEYVTEIARRIAAIVLFQPTLDENYRSVKAATYSWPQSE